MFAFITKMTIDESRAYVLTKFSNQDEDDENEDGKRKIKELVTNC